MALPHVIQKQLIEKRIRRKEGKQKINEINQILDELPKWASGPYADLRKWLQKQIAVTKTRSHVKHQDWLGVKKEGSKQFVLVGCPSVGKSSLLKALSKMDIKIAAYAFTTLKPIPAIVDVNGADIQIVDLPGLVEGATEDVGGGKRLMGLVKQADGIILMHDLTKPFSETNKIVKELQKAGIQKKIIVVANKIDLAPLKEIRKHYPDVIGISAQQETGLDELKQAIWEQSGLIRVSTGTDKPVILDVGSTVQDLARKIHKDLLKKFKHALVTGPSAKFDNQQAGLTHVLQDGDSVHIKTLF